MTVVNIGIPGKASFDQAKMEKITRQVLGRLGCERCHSGYDFRYTHMRDFKVNPETLEVEERFG